jgi:hypothetical protein
MWEESALHASQQISQKESLKLYHYRAALGVALHHLPLLPSLCCVGGIVTGIILTRMTRS